jgi:EAL domain-containing protein (putative c-di-GMP-specific phosphodiesterase class I)
MRLSEDERDAAIARSMVDLGRRLGMGVVAEGVEDLDTWRALAGWGCDEAQGHLLGRPMPAGELTAWLQRLAHERPDVADPRVWAAVRR